METISLTETEVKGCLGCNACRYEKPCIQRAGGCGDTNRTPNITNTVHLEAAYQFGISVYDNE